MRLSDKWRNSWTTVASESAFRRQQRATIEGEAFEIVRMGKGDPIVVVPGLAGGWKLTTPLLRRLARTHQVITYNLRGDRSQGDSRAFARTPYVEIGAHAADLAALIERLGLERPALLGVSFGGAIALELAVDHPGLIDSLVLQGMEACFKATTASGIVRRVLERYDLPIDSPFINQFLNLLYAKKPEPGPQADFVVDRIWETPQGVMAQRIAQLEQFDVSDRLWRLDVPTLVLAGSNDVIVPASRQKRLAAEISNSRFETLDGAGHIGFVTHAEAMARQVQAHLQRVRSAV